MAETEKREPYIKSFEDELDWNLIEQLHRVVLQTGNFCFRTKQIAIIVDVAVIGVLIKLAEHRLNHAIFIAGLTYPFVFFVFRFSRLLLPSKNSWSNG